MQNENDKRLIEVAFPLKQVSLDSVHEKNVRHGHISTLHIWPARRPLAACRAALIATLLRDPGDPEKRRQIYERMAGRVVEKIERKRLNGRIVEKVKEETVGGILHWGREDGPDLQWFRDEIRKAYGGRAPRVLDPFAGGGAIPLEAMRLGCEATAIDINPVAWFILKCTLEYPQKLAAQTRPLPDFALKDREFMEAFLKAKGFKGASLRTMLERLGLGDGHAVQLDALAPTDPHLQADLAWHVRGWGRWVLAQARKELATYYPTYADFEALEPGRSYEPRPTQMAPLDENGIARVERLNAEFAEEYLRDPRNPRWVAKPTVAYLWARTVKCKQCRATIPLLKTRWLCKKDNKRVLLTMEPNADRTGVVFGVQRNVPVVGGNAAQRREHDKRIGAGTMSRTGATCPCCGAVMTMEDIRVEGRSGRVNSVPTAVVVHKLGGKDYRQPMQDEIKVGFAAAAAIANIYQNVPFGIPDEALSSSRTQGNSGFRVILYGFNTWKKLFGERQLLSIGQLMLTVRSIGSQISSSEWSDAVRSYLALAIDRFADAGSTIAHWQSGGEFSVGTFQRFALPMSWDFSEVSPFSGATGSVASQVEWIALVLEHLLSASKCSRVPIAHCRSAISPMPSTAIDIIVTDPPYYDAIAYSDVMDFFYVWLRRILAGLNSATDEAMRAAHSPKWDSEIADGELIDDPSRSSGNREISKKIYEDGMATVFTRCHEALSESGQFVIVFAHKHPDAWETLVSSIIRAGFVVDASWPIQTERTTRTNAISTASLASSVWLVCRKRRNIARPGWDTAVLADMRENIGRKLREFWDAGIRGPDFVWAATGPALEAYSKHPVVKKADDPGKVMSVSEFLREVRRIVVDFVVGRVLTGEQGEPDMSAAESLDDVTTYYLLHRHDFGLDEAPIGACILYALSCNLSDGELADRWDILARSGGASADDESDDESDDDAQDADEDGEGGGSGVKVKLRGWNQRRGRNLGMEAPGGRPIPLIDQVHKLMQLWRAGEEAKVDDYLDLRGLKRNALFNKVLQAVVELAGAGSDERALLESISNHIAARGGFAEPRQRELPA